MLDSFSGRNGDSSYKVVLMGIYSLFAEVLNYPFSQKDGEFGKLSERLAVECPAAVERLDEFRAAIGSMGLKKLQETYTEAFDLRPDATTNLSHHMFGEDARRGVFMAELKGKMMALGMSMGVELPDHICLILEFMDRAPDEERQPLIEDCLLPSLEKMDGVLTGCSNPYHYLLETLESFLKTQNQGDGSGGSELVSAGETRVG